MAKPLSFLLCALLSISIHASDPRITQAFEEQPNTHSPIAPHQEGNQELTREPAVEPQKYNFSTEDLIQVIFEMDQEKKLADQKVQELAELNKRLEENAERCAQLASEIKQHEQDKNTLFWILAPCIPTAALVGALVPKAATTIINDVKNNQGVIRTTIPEFLDEYMQLLELNKTLAQATAQGMHVEINTSQLIQALYNTLNSSELQALTNNGIQRGKLWAAQYRLSPEDFRGQTKHALARLAHAADTICAPTKEDLVRVLLTHTAVSMLTTGIQVTDDKVLIELPNKTIVLHKSQLVEAGTETAATWVSDFVHRRQRPTARQIGSDFAQNVGTEIGYNAVVQLMHAAANKAGSRGDALKVLLPEDCKPKDIVSFYAKVLIRWGVGMGASLVAQPLSSSARTLAQRVLMRAIRIPYH